MEMKMDKIRTIRDIQLSRGLNALAIFGSVALFASLASSLKIGWHNIMYIHIGVYAVVLGCALLKNYLSFHIRALFILSITFFLGVASLISWGLIAYGLPALISFCILTTILYGTRSGIISFILSIIILALIGVFTQLGLLTFELNIETYLTSFASWLNSIIVMALTAGLMLVALGTINKKMIELIQKLEERNSDLRDANIRLKMEIEERENEEKRRRKLESRLRRAEKMEVIGTLAGGVAHDLNNILVATVSYPDVLLTQISEDNPLRQPIKAIQESGKKAAAIVNDLLTLARRGVVASEVLNLNDVISEYLKSPVFDKLNSYHPGVEIEVNLNEELRNIIGSPVHLSNTLMNLVSNAAEAIQNKGKISISTKNITVTQTIKGYDEIREGEYVVLSVKDTGAGISSKDTERIFEPFYTKKKMGRSGTGLGMSVVWGTVKDHEGYIDLKSTEGKGTIFDLYFPITDRELAKQETLLIEEYKGNKEKILVVDDVKEQRDLANIILTKLGYTVDTVANGEEAVEYIKKNKADLLLLDMLMEPGTDGLGTYEKVLYLNPNQKAIIMSGYSETERVREAQELGAGNFIKKPFSLGQIGMAIRAELDR